MQQLFPVIRFFPKLVFKRRPLWMFAILTITVGLVFPLALETAFGASTVPYRPAPSKPRVASPPKHNPGPPRPQPGPHPHPGPPHHPQPPRPYPPPRPVPPPPYNPYYNGYNNGYYNGYNNGYNNGYYPNYYNNQYYYNNYPAQQANPSNYGFGPGATVRFMLGK